MKLPDHIQKVLSKVNVAIRDGRSVLLRGPAGCGKTMLVHRVSCHYKENIYVEVSAIRRMAGFDWSGSAIRVPHHTVSLVGMIGDGKRFRPGELSLAHGGVLFLDEIDEFQNNCLRAVANARRDKCVEYGLDSKWLRGLPADFALIGAMNVCDGMNNSKVRRQKEVLDIIKFDLEINLPNF